MAAELLGAIDTSFIKPRLRLFLSVDLVGSTALKQSYQSQAKRSKGSVDQKLQDWLEAIVRIFHRFEVNLERAWAEYSASVEAFGEMPTLWKALGDELIYFVELLDPKHALACIQLWRKVVYGFRQEFLADDPSTKLDLKCAAWIAGFPSLNAEIILSSATQPQDRPSDWRPDDWWYRNLEEWRHYYGDPTRTSRLIDFAGPSIDLGFRLATLSSPRKFVISVDLALVLADGYAWWSEVGTKFYSKPTFRFDGRRELRGIMGGQPYPIFWVDMKRADEAYSFQRSNEDELFDLEDKLLHQEDVGPAQVKAYAEKYLGSGQNVFGIPYIVELGNEGSVVNSVYNKIPSEHLQRITSLRTAYLKETEKSRTTAASLRSVDGGAEAKSESDVNQVMAAARDAIERVVAEGKKDGE